MLISRKYRKLKKPIIIALALIIAAVIVFVILKKHNTLFTQKAPSKIRFALSQDSGVIVGQVGLILQNKDFLQKDGFDEAQISALNSENDARVALLNGQADAVVADEDAAVRILGSGFGADIVAGWADGQIALVTLGNSGINDLADLKGKKIGIIPGSLAQKQTMDWLKSAGLDPSKDASPVRNSDSPISNGVQFMNFPDMDNARNALNNDMVDAIVDSDPGLTQGVDNGKYKILAQADLSSLVLVSADYAQKNPDALEKLKNALKDSMSYLMQNKDQAITWYSASSKLDKNMIAEISQESLAYKNGDSSITVSADLVARLNALDSYLFDQKMVREKVDATQSIK